MLRGALLVLLFVACCASAAEITFNSESAGNCTGEFGCSFSDGTIWIGGVPPANNDSVVIENLHEFAIAINFDNMTLSLYSLSVSGTNGNMTFLMSENSALEVPSISLSGLATFIVDHSYLLTATITGGSMLIRNGATTGGGFIAPDYVTVINSNVYNRYVTPEFSVSAINSVINGTINTKVLYFYGNMTFSPISTNPSISDFGYFEGIPNLYISILSLTNGTQIEFVDCVATINEISTDYNSLVSFSASSPEYTVVTVGDVLGTGGQIQIGNGIRFSVGGGHGSLIAGDDVIVNVTGGSTSQSPFTLLGLQTEYTEIVVYGIGHLVLPYYYSAGGVINASISTIAGGQLDINGNITLSSSGATNFTGSCISGSGSVSISGNLQCPGQTITAGYVEIDAYTTLNASLQVTTLAVYSPSTIHGNVSVTNGGSKFTSGPLVVNGWFSQNSGTLNISQATSSLPSPYLQVSGSVSFTSAQAYLWLLPPTDTSKILFASSSSTATADVVVKDSLSVSTTATVSAEGNNIYLVFTKTKHNNGIFDKPWVIPVIVAGGALGLVLFILIIVCAVRRKSRRHHYAPVH